MEVNKKKDFVNIENMYKKLTYFDHYGGSLLSLFFITFLVIILCAYCYAKINIQPIVNDWPNQRCKPYYLPIAGFITKPDNMTASDYTLENFNYCSQNILSSITGTMLEPLTFVTQTMNGIVSQIIGDVDYSRAMFSKVRTFFQSTSQEIMGRLMNIMIPLQQIIISFRDMIGKVQGMITAGLFTLLGSYYTLQSLMGSIAELIIIILIAMVAMIFLFWLVPFTWGAAISMTSIFVALSIPMAIMLAFMVDVLQVQPDLSIPTIKVPTLKCFDKNTLLLMKDGQSKRIEDISVGDHLYYDGKVTAKMKVEKEGSIMYMLDGTIVSDTHLVHYKGKWMRVNEHPDAIQIDNSIYNEKYLYCLNTTSKTIYINNTLFSDWDELIGDDFLSIINNPILKKRTSCEIHHFLDSGFVGDTKIQLHDGSFKKINDIEVGDILLNGEKVYGIVEIDGSTLTNQYQYILGKDTFMKGGPNINIYSENEKSNSKSNSETSVFSTLNLDEGTHKKILKNREDKLYHLITNTKTFYINKIQIYDYNATIDLLLKKNKK